MNVIVFGGSGFIGNQVAKELYNSGHNVTIYDKYLPKTPLENIYYIQGDITHTESVLLALKNQDIVYNYAGIADIGEAQLKQIETVSINVLGNSIILDAIEHTPSVEKYIFASTVYVYSKSGGFYRCSKQACETYIEEWHQHTGTDYVILRYGTLYGPDTNHFNSIHNYLKKAITTSVLEAEGTGLELREYIHIQDAAQISVKIIDSQFKNENIIIAGHQSYRVNDLFNMIEEILGKPVTITYKNSKSSKHYNITPYSYIPKTGRKLYAESYIDLGQGLLECIQEIYKKGTIQP